MKTTFIGGGNMAEAILSAILNQHLCHPDDIVVSDINEERLQYLVSHYGVLVTTDKQEAISNSAVIVLAVKPQNLDVVASELQAKLHGEQLLISILAGVTINSITTKTGHQSVVRAMPNTPAQIGEGMTVWTATSVTSELQRKQASSILGSMGREVYADSEKYLDMATAVSGSGPAYIFLMAEAMTKAAVNAGLPVDMAQELVVQTIIGSGNLIRQSKLPPDELRRRVTSPGGTTAAALEKMTESGFEGIINSAVQAAYIRAQQLGQ